LNRILLDQGLPRSTAKILGVEGWDVLHTGDIGLSIASDREIIELIEKIWPKIQTQLEKGALVTITEKSIRVRKIPLADME